MNILIDLSILRHPHCGLGQIALNYGRWYGRHADGLGRQERVTLLVPAEYVDAFGTGVDYLPARTVYRYMPWLLPDFDVWHSIHQLSPFRPRRGTRRILTIHDLNFLYEKHGAKQRRYLDRLQRECDSATEVCFISQFARNEAVSHLDLQSKRLHTIYNGVEDMTAGPLQRPQGVDETKPFLLCMGVVKAKKNVHTLLPMMDLLPEYNLVVAGPDGDPYAQRLRHELGTHPNVTMTGTVSDEERRWLYAHCVGLVMPSVAEGFGLPVIEAMQWGKAVFASRYTSLPEIGAECAAYFPDFSPEAMAATVRQGLASRTADDTQAAILHAAQFDYESHMRQYWQLYRHYGAEHAEPKNSSRLKKNQNKTKQVTKK